MTNKKSWFKPNKSDCALIGASLLVGFFVVWFLWGIVLKDFDLLCWIENHPGLAAWVQAVGAITAIIATAFIAQRDTKLREFERDKAHSQEMRKIRYLLHDIKFMDAVDSYLLRVKFSQEHKNNIAINNYRNIFFFIYTLKEFKILESTINDIDTEKSMQLRTSELGDYFSKIFIDVKYLSHFYSLNHDYLNLPDDINKFRSFGKYVNENTSAYLQDVNEDLNSDFEFSLKLSASIENSINYIKSQLNTNWPD